jgi:hypothetical protein
MRERDVLEHGRRFPVQLRPGVHCWVGRGEYKGYTGSLWKPSRALFEKPFKHVVFLLLLCFAEMRRHWRVWGKKPRLRVPVLEHSRVIPVHLPVRLQLGSWWEALSRYIIVFFQHSFILIWILVVHTAAQLITQDCAFFYLSVLILLHKLLSIWYRKLWNVVNTIKQLSYNFSF